MRRLSTSAMAVVAALLFGVAGAAEGGLLIYEGWDYTPGDTDPANWTGGAGFDAGSSWVNQRGHSTGTIVAALDFSDYDDTFGTGGALSASASGNSDTFHRAVDVARTGADGPTWAAFLFRFGQYTSSSFNNQHGYLHFAPAAPDGNINGTSSDLGDLVAAPQRRQGGDDNVRVGVGGGDTGAAFAVTGDTSVHLFVVRWTDETADGDYDRAEMWVMSAADYDAAKAGGVTAADLGAHHRAHVVDTTGTGSMALEDLLQIQLRRYGFAIDEIQYGSSLADLNGFAPEPATLCLVALGGLAMVAARRRR